MGRASGLVTAAVTMATHNSQRVGLAAVRCTQLGGKGKCVCVDDVHKGGVSDIQTDGSSGSLEVRLAWVQACADTAESMNPGALASELGALVPEEGSWAGDHL